MNRTTKPTASFGTAPKVKTVSLTDRIRALATPTSIEDRIGTLTDRRSDLLHRAEVAAEAVDGLRRLALQAREWAHISTGSSTDLGRSERYADPTHAAMFGDSVTLPASAVEAALPAMREALLAELGRLEEQIAGINAELAAIS